MLGSKHLVVDTIINRLTDLNVVTGTSSSPHYATYGFFVPMNRIGTHFCAAVELPTIATNFTRLELSKLHCSLFHASADSLFTFIGRGRPDEVHPETRRTLEKITRSCDPFHGIQTSLRRFRDSFGAEDVVFNFRVLLHEMYIDSNPIFHVVDNSTSFSVALFLSGTSTNTIWSVFLQFWSLIYTGLPNRIIVDQGPAFGDHFVAFGRLSRFNVSATGI